MTGITPLRNFIQRHTVLARRMDLREKLLLQSDAVLARKGYSRELIEQGLTAWPWKVQAGAVPAPADSDEQLSSRWIRSAARALNAYHRGEAVPDAQHAANVSSRLLA